MNVTVNVGKLFSGIALAFRTYPALLLAALNIGVVVAAHFGYHVTTDQLASIAVTASAFVGVIVHNAVTPNVRVQTKDKVNGN
jgi:hypothetical protein